MLTQADIQEVLKEGLEELNKICNEEAMLDIAIEKCGKSAERKGK